MTCHNEIPVSKQWISSSKFRHYIAIYTLISRRRDRVKGRRLARRTFFFLPMLLHWPVFKNLH